MSALNAAVVDRSEEQVGSAILFDFIFAIPITLWTGFVTMALWNWFVPSALPGVPTLNLVHAIGLGLVAEIFIFHASFYRANPRKTALGNSAYNMGVNAALGVTVLVTGFVVHLFM